MAENLDDDELLQASEILQATKNLLERTRGRPQAISDGDLLQNRDYLVWLLERTWGEVGLILRRARTRRDIAEALKSWKNYAGANPVVKILLRSGGETVSPKSLRALLRTRKQLLNALYKQEPEWDRARQSLERVSAVTDVGLSKHQKRILTKQIARRKDTVELAEAKRTQYLEQIRTTDIAIDESGHI